MTSIVNSLDLGFKKVAHTSTWTHLSTRVRVSVPRLLQFCIWTIPDFCVASSSATSSQRGRSCPRRSRWTTWLAGFVVVLTTPSLPPAEQYAFYCTPRKVDCRRGRDRVRVGLVKAIDLPHTNNITDTRVLNNTQAEWILSLLFPPQLTSFFLFLAIKVGGSGIWFWLELGWVGFCYVSCMENASKAFFIFKCPNSSHGDFRQKRMSTEMWKRKTMRNIFWQGYPVTLTARRHSIDSPFKNTT